MELKFRTLNADEIDCRLAQVSKTGSGMFLLYKDARCDMAMLDEVVGPMNWKREHTRDNSNCIVSIWDSEKNQWISKEDTGTESNTEKEKGLASDSFKRACFNWGIGRELYTAPTIWVKPLQGEDIKYLRLKCKNIGYNDKREITMLELVDGNGTLRYKYDGNKNGQPQPLQPPTNNAMKFFYDKLQAANTADEVAAVWVEAGENKDIAQYMRERCNVLGISDDTMLEAIKTKKSK